MHSYEERMRAVALYIKLAKRVQTTIRELGYPTKNTLRGWYREYERYQDVSIGSAPRQPKFSEAKKTGRARALCQPRALHLMDDACVRLSRPSEADCMGARGFP
jgi:transposase-like protein